MAPAGLEPAFPTYSVTPNRLDAAISGVSSVLVVRVTLEHLLEASELVLLPTIRVGVSLAVCRVTPDLPHLRGLVLLCHE